MELSGPVTPAAGDRLAVLLVDGRGKPLAASAGFGELFGPPGQLEALDDAGQPLPRADWPVARLRRGDAFSVPLSLTLRDGSRRPFTVSGYPFETADKALPAGVLIVEETTSVDEPGQVAALVSHELRTPLTVLHAALQLMDRSLTAGETEVARHYLDEALAEARQLNVLTGQLLEAARLASGQLRLRREPVQLMPVLRDVCARAQRLSRGQRIALAEPLPGLCVYADPTRLDQMLMQLLVNAVVYSPPSAAIDVSLHVDDGEAALEVRDHGGELSGRRLARLGEPFYQAPRRDRPSRGGLGLGLFVCGELARLHGGRLAASAHGRDGSTFTLWLPLAAEPRETGPRPIRQDVSPERRPVR